MTESIKTLRELVNASSSIVFFGGAGVSTESGIPDFRSTGGLYLILTAPGFKVKLIFHHRPVSTATNRSLLAHRYNFVGNSSGNKEFLPEPPGIIR